AAFRLGLDAALGLAWFGFRKKVAIEPHWLFLRGVKFRERQGSRHALSPAVQVRQRSALRWGQRGRGKGGGGQSNGERAGISSYFLPLTPSLSPTTHKWAEVVLHFDRGGEGVARRRFS